MHSRFQDLVPVHLKDEGDPDLDRPSEEDIEEVKLNFVVFTSSSSFVCSNNPMICAFQVQNQTSILYFAFLSIIHAFTTKTKTNRFKKQMKKMQFNFS